VPERVPYEYAVVRVVPRVDRDEFINAGVIVFAKQQRLLEARVEVNDDRLRALWPEVDVATVRQHLNAIRKICMGDDAAGPIARMSQSERFHWLTTPRSTVIQTSPIRTGLSSNLEELPDELERKLIEVVPAFIR
jgi:Protein of unknown function (DUF3037)